MARCLLTACRVIDAPDAARRAQSSFKVWPLWAYSRSRSSLRLASARALNTSSMATICNHLVACQPDLSRRGAALRRATLFFRRFLDGVVAFRIEADEVPGLLHVRRQR